MIKLPCSFTIIALILSSMAQLMAESIDYITKTDVPYYAEETRAKDDYINSRCKLDLHYPKGKKDFATLVWFHGGGLTSGDKKIPIALQRQGIAVVSVNYRLHPKVKAPAYIEDAAAAVAWTFNNIERFGGKRSRIFVSGMSAGGYLTSMVGIDKKWLKPHGISANEIAGLIPLSGHCITHFTVRKEMGILGKQPLIDELAPLFHVRHDAPPLLLITGDRHKELLGRYEETAYMMRMMKVAGHHDTTLYEIQGYGHGIQAAAIPLVLKEIKRVLKAYER